MSGGKYDSSLTRVAPVFDQLSELQGDWVRHLLELAEAGSSRAGIPTGIDLTFVKGWWGDSERGFTPRLGPNGSHNDRTSGWSGTR